MLYLVNEETKEHRAVGSWCALIKGPWRYVQADADGWIKWEGGECPVERGTLVDVRHRDGDVGFGQPAEKAGSGPVQAACWVHYGNDGDIIAYRPILEEADGECSDEMPCEAVTPEWDGVGLPPVGMVCEVNYCESWVECEVIAHFRQRCSMVAAFTVGDAKGKSLDAFKAGLFRPICSEEDRAVDEMKAVAGVSCVEPDHMEMITRALYRAGYRKTNTNEEK